MHVPQVVYAPAPPPCQDIPENEMGIEDPLEQMPENLNDAVGAGMHCTRTQRDTSPINHPSLVDVDVTPTKKRRRHRPAPAAAAESSDCDSLFCDAQGGDDIDACSVSDSQSNACASENPHTDSDQDDDLFDMAEADNLQGPSPVTVHSKKVTTTR